jgi:hypothetical protein
VLPETVFERGDYGRELAKRAERAKRVGWGRGRDRLFLGHAGASHSPHEKAQ